MKPEWCILLHTWCRNGVHIAVWIYCNTAMSHLPAFERDAWQEVIRERDSLRSLLHDREKEIQRLQDSLRARESSPKKYEEEEEESGETGTPLPLLRQRDTFQRAVIEKLRVKNLAYKQSLLGYDRLKKQLEAKLRDAEQELQKAKLHHVQQLSKLEEEHQVALEDSETLLREARVQVEQQDSEIAEQRQTIKQQRERLQEQEAELSQQRESLAKRREEVSELNALVQQLRLQAAQAAKGNAAEAKLVQQHASRVSQLQTQLVERDEQLTRHRQEAAQLRAELADCQSTVERLGDENREQREWELQLQQETSRMQAQLSQQALQLTQHQQQHAELQQALADAESQARTALEKHRRTHETNLELMEQVHEMQEEVRATQETHATWRDNAETAVKHSDRARALLESVLDDAAADAEDALEVSLETAAKTASSILAQLRERDKAGSETAASTSNRSAGMRSDLSHRSSPLGTPRRISLSTHRHTPRSVPARYATRRVDFDDDLEGLEGFEPAFTPSDDEAAQSNAGDSYYGDADGTAGAVGAIAQQPRPNAPVPVGQSLRDSASACTETGGSKNRSPSHDIDELSFPSSPLLKFQ
ncbi:MAG: hypothetical protein MHM6MM_004144 [Cercozoa sp. M6MM]